MNEHEDSTLLIKGPCGDCGSSDACAVYDDGHTHCFSCGTTHQNKGEAPKVEKMEKRKDLIEIGKPLAWKSRSLTAETCKKWGITVSEFMGQKVRVFNYRNDKQQVVAQKTRTSGKDMRFLGDAKNAGLYGKHLWRTGGKMLVITEGEIDAASVSQVQGHKWPVVSVKNGATGAAKDIQKDLDWVQSFEKVVLLFDMDAPGQQAAVECAGLLRPGQCAIGRLEVKDANEALVAGQGKSLIDAIWNAKEYRPDGVVLGTDLLGLLSEEKETFSVTFPWQKLQEQTKGVRPGEVVTLTAGTGIGKSSIVRELAHHMLVQGENVGLMMFEEPIKRSALGIMSVEMSKNLTLLNHPHKEEGFVDAYNATVGSGRLSLYDHFGSTEIENVLDRARYMAKALSARWLFIDHLSILISGMGEGDERRLIDNAMTAIKTLAMECNVGIFLVSHLKRPEKGKGHEEGAQTSLSQLRGSHAIAQLSDTVIGVERNQQDEEHKHITTMRLLKCRWTGDSGLAGWLEYNRETGRLKELLDDPFTTPSTFEEGGIF